MTSVAYGAAFPAIRGVLVRHYYDPAGLFAGDTGGWWDPFDLSALFQDSAGTVPVTAADQPVGRVNDKSGNGNHLTQASAAQRPMLRSGGGLRWLEFDGVDDALTASFLLNQPFTRVSAARQAAYGTTGPPRLWDGATLNSGGVVQYAASPSITLDGGTLAAANSDMSVGANHVVTEIWNGAGSKLAIDANGYTTGNPGSGNPGGAVIGNAAISRPSNILWFGAVWIGRVLSDAEIAPARTYFGGKAGISL